MTKNDVKKETETTTEITSFSDFNLSEEVINGIKKKGFEEPTDIQKLTIPIMLKNDRNIIAQAQTGTGKTAAFGLPLINMIDCSSKSVQALILAPTRELAIQVAEEINSLKGKKKLVIVPIYGGQSIDQQLRRLKKGAHIIVGTPGRIIDHLNRKTLKIQNIDHLVLDEADEMLNMGFIDDMEEIMKHTNEDKKTLLFSATMPQKIKSLAKRYMTGYELLAVKNKQLTTSLTEQIYFEVKLSDKFEALSRIVDFEEEFYGLIFCRTKNDVDTVTQQLTDRGYDVEAIHGDISQNQREKTLDRFKRKKINILVATDVAARGIDVNNLTHVINYSLPQDPESYVHRIGRTGRSGNQGTAITFITPREYRQLMFIQRAAKADIKKSTVPKVQDIIKAKTKRINNDLIAIREEEIDKKYLNWAQDLLKDNDAEKVLASLLTYSFEEKLNADAYGELKPIGASSRDSKGQSSSSRGRQLDQEGKARLFVALGKKDGYDVKKLVNLVIGRVSIKYKQIRDIQIMDNFSFISVPFEKAEEIVANFKEEGKRPIITHAKKSR